MQSEAANEPWVAPARVGAPIFNFYRASTPVNTFRTAVLVVITLTLMDFRQVFRRVPLCGEGATASARTEDGQDFL